MRRTLLLAVTALWSALLLPGAARADAFGPCPKAFPAAARCTSTPVPLDRSGATAGELALFVARVPATGRRRGTLVLLAGGPGDGASWYFTARRHLDDFGAARRTHDLLIVDTRGAGRSRALACTDPAECAAALGPARGHYTSADVAADLEAIRAQLGLRRWSLYGISYGTYEAQAYARAYPRRVARLVLDSAVDTIITADPWRLAKTRALKPALRAACPRRRCRAFTSDPWDDFVRLVDRLEVGPLDGRRVDAKGRAQAATLSPTGVDLAAGEADVNEDLRAELSGAVVAALRGDAAPMLRLAEVAALPTPASPRQHSRGRFLVTACQEQGVPWSPGTPPADRLDEAGRRLAELPANAFAPFSQTVGLVNSLVFDCEAWPPTAGTPPVGGSLPDVPALLLHGDTDVRTPLEGARRIARSLPRGRLVVIRGAGHNILREAGSPCPERYLGAFLAGRRLPACRDPSSFRSVPPPPARPGRSLRRAAVLTVGDSLRQAAMRRDHLRGLVAAVRFGGLRGGSVSAGRRRLVLRNVQYVSGVRVSGTVDRNGHGTVRVRGAGRSRSFRL